jgi:rhamnopyranosyl-N-acetylglucosaminyl-diphospho-decaprenol beta-1,3/1,4-galactofuranosyltransferase
MIHKSRLCCVVVTFNRKNLLKQCLHALLRQTHQPDRILVIDNNSTDGTEELMHSEFGGYSIIQYEKLASNTGGGGGFSTGMRLAYQNDFEWVWLMDDDCLPEKDCLKRLLIGTQDIKNIYSPVILSIEDKKTILWGIKVAVNSGNQEVPTLPFNGFLVHRESIAEIGFPEKLLFIYGDDTEYNLRAKQHGRKIIMVTNAIMYHPHKNKIRRLKVEKIFVNKLWVYYKLRNAIIIFNRYRYFSVNQALMFGGALCYFILTLRLGLLRLWIQAFKDGVKNNLYILDDFL